MFDFDDLDVAEDVQLRGPSQTASDETDSGPSRGYADDDSADVASDGRAGDASASDDGPSATVTEIDPVRTDTSVTAVAESTASQSADGDAAGGLPSHADEEQSPDQGLEVESSTPTTDASRTETAGTSKEVYWKILGSPGDSSGIRVREDEMLTSKIIGRLEQGSIIKELERSGSRIHYEAVDVYSAGPKTGWASVNVGSREFMTCVGHDYASVVKDLSPMPPLNGRVKALILLDWDDTLCPTSWIETQSKERPELRRSMSGTAVKTGEIWDQLNEQAKAVDELIRLAATLGAVAVVTLAQRPWVLVSARDFLPQALPEVSKLEVFYARETPQNRGSPGACMWTSMKKRSMQMAMSQLIGRFGKNATWDSLVSIGDSEVEKRAAQDLGRDCQIRGTVKWTKTVKFKERPTVLQLKEQVQELIQQLPSLIEHPGRKDINLAETVSAR